MLLQNMHPAVLKNPPAGMVAHSHHGVATPTSNILTAAPPRIIHPTVSLKMGVAKPGTTPGPLIVRISI